MFYYSTDKDNVQLWLDAYGVLTTALELSRACVTREANLEAEILLTLGMYNDYTRAALSDPEPVHV